MIRDFNDVYWQVVPIYVNDIHDVVFHSRIKLFADDVAIYKTIYTSDDCIQLQGDLNHHFLGRQMAIELNSNNCEAFLISRKCSPHQRHILVMEISGLLFRNLHQL